MAKTKTTLNPVQRVRQERIIQAAERAFLNHGFRNATMETIAEEAQISKVTLYSYFEDKDSVFVAVATALAKRLDHAFNAALASSSVPSERIAKALVTKHNMIFQTVRASRFSQDLFDAKDKVAKDAFVTLDQNLQRSIAQVLQATGRNTADAHSLSNLIFSACMGIANHGKTIEQISKDIATLVRALVPSPTRAD